MPLQDFQNIPAPPRSFASPLQRWLYLLAADKLQPLLLGIALGCLLLLPFVVRDTLQYNEYIAQLRPIPAQVQYLETTTTPKKTTPRAHSYRILYNNPQGIACTTELKTEARLGCLRESLQALHTFCEKADTVFYTDLPKPSVLPAKPMMQPLYSLILILPLLVGSLAYGFVLYRRRRQRLPLLYLGLVAEGKQVSERVDHTYAEQRDEGKMLRREYEFIDLHDTPQRFYQKIRSKNAEYLPPALPVLYPIDDPKNALIFHPLFDDSLPEIARDGRLYTRALPLKILIAVGIMLFVWVAGYVHILPFCKGF